MNSGYVVLCESCFRRIVKSRPVEEASVGVLVNYCEACRKPVGTFAGNRARTPRREHFELVWKEKSNA